MIENNNNPYTTPSTHTLSATEENSVPCSPRPVKAARGVKWLHDGFILFKKAPLSWLGIMVVWIILTAVSITIPFVGIAQPFLTAGIAATCYRLDTEGNLVARDLLTGFSQQATPLLLIGVISTVGSTMVIFGASTIGLGSFMSMAEVSQEPLSVEEAANAMKTFLLLLLGAATLLTPLIMAVWYAPLLIVLNQIPTFTAMRLSFNACCSNVLPILVITLTVIPLLVIAAIPLFLGYFILIPVLMTSVYTSYKDIFLSPELAEN